MNNRSESIANIAAALAVAQGEIEGAIRNAQNQHLRSSYADLASCWAACQPHLSKNSLALIQAPFDAGQNRVGLETTIVHKSGEWLSSRWSVPVTKNDPQGFGSALTYIRRYSLVSMIGIAQVDDDGEAASGNAPKHQPKAIDQGMVETIKGLSSVSAVNDFYRQLSAEERATYTEQLATRKRELAAS